MATRDELVAVVAERYARSTRKDRGRILDEFGAMTGLHRKHAMRLLRCGMRSEQSGPRLRRRVYDDAVREALVPPVIDSAVDLRIDGTATTESIRGRERDRRKEVRGEAQR